MCHFTLIHPKRPINKNLSYLTFRVVAPIYELLTNQREEDRAIKPLLCMP